MKPEDLKKDTHSGGDGSRTFDILRLFKLSKSRFSITRCLRNTADIIDELEALLSLTPAKMEVSI